MNFLETAKQVKEIFGESVEVITLCEKPKSQEETRLDKFFKYCQSTGIKTNVTFIKDSYEISASKVRGKKTLHANGSGYTLSQALDDLGRTMKKVKMI